MALDSDSGAAQRSLDTLANAYGLQCSDIIKNTTWGAGSSIKMSRRKQQKPRQFPTDSDDAGTTENGVSQAVVSGHLAELDTEAVAADHITVRAVSANASVVEEDVDDDACDVSEDLEHLDDLLKQVQRQTSEPEEKNKDIKTMSTTTINGHFEGDIASNGDEQIEEDRASLDQESLDPDEDIDEEELDAMDNEDSEGSNSAEAASRVLAQNVKLNRLQNTNVAVQQIVENNDFGSAPVGWKRLADHIIFLTHQQAIQMLKLDEIWQLILRCSPEDEQRALDTSRERAKHPPRSLSLPRDLNFGASMTEACKMISAYMAHQVATAQFPNISGNTPLTVVKDSTTAPIPSLGVAPSIGSVPSTSSLPHPSEPTKASSDGATKSAPPSGGIQQAKFPFIDPTASLPGLSLPSTPTPRADTDSPSAAPLPGGSSFSMDRSQYAAPDDGLFRHKCRFCHKVLGSDSALQIHIRSHTGEKPFKCNVCGNRFSTKGNLKVHFDRHKQQYPHLEMDDRMYPEDPAEKERANSVMPLPPAPPSPPAMEPIPIAPRPPQSQQTQPVAASQPLIASSANGPPSPPRKVIEIAPKKDEAEEQQPLPPRMPPFPLHGMPPFLPTSMAMTIPMSLPGSMPMPMLSAPNGMGMPPPGMPGLPPGMDPSMFHRPSILPQNNAEDEDDPMEQYMEIQKSETSKLEDMVKGMDDKLTDPNQCAICMRILSCKSALQMHYRTHTGERPFKCKICGRAFTTKGNLKTHMGVHRSKPPLRMMHQCPVCHKQFTNALVLQQHIRTHTASDVPKMFPDMMNPMMGFPMPFPGHGLPGMPGMPGMPPFPHPGMMPQGMDLSSGRSQDDGDNSNMTGLDDSMDSIDEGEELGNKRDRSYLDKESNRDLDNERPAKQMRKDENESSEKQMPEENIPDKDKSQENQQRDGCERNTNEEPSKVSSEATDKPGQPPMSLPFPFYNHMPPVSSSHNHNPSSAYSSMSLAALQDKVNAISQQNFNQFSPFQQLHAGSFPTMGNGSHADDSENDDDISDGSSNSEDPQSLESQEKSTKNGDETRLDQPVQPISEATTTTNTHSKNSFPGENQENQTSVMNEDIVTPPKSDRSGNSSPSKEKENPVVSNAILMSRIPISSSSSIENMAMSSPIDPYTPRRNKDNRHMCHVCNKPFSSSSALQIHMRTHTGERPFKCEICAKAFTTRGNLKVHMSTHAQQLSPARRGRRMSMEGIPGLTPPKETGDFYPPPGGRLFPGAELFPHGLPFPFPPPNGFFPPGGKPGNAIPVIQSPMFPHGMLQGLAAIKAESNGEKNNNASPDHMAKLVGLPTPELFQQHHNKLAAFAMEKHHEPSTEQGLNLSVK